MQGGKNSIEEKLDDIKENLRTFETSLADTITNQNKVEFEQMKQENKEMIKNLEQMISQLIQK